MLLQQQQHQLHGHYHPSPPRHYQSSSHSPYPSSPAYPMQPASPALSLPSYPTYPASSDELDTAFTDHAMLMLSDSELPPAAHSPSLPSTATHHRPSYSPVQPSLPSLSPLPSPIPLQQYPTSFSSSDRAEPFSHQHAPHSPSLYDAFSSASGGRAEVRGEAHTPQFRAPVSPHRSPASLYPAHSVHAIPVPNLQLRSTSANTSPRAVSSYLPSYPAQAAYAAVAVPRLQTPPHSSSSSPSTSRSLSPSSSSAHLHSVIQSALAGAKGAVPAEELMQEVSRQLGYHTPPSASSPLLSPRSQATSPAERRMVRVELQSLASLLLAVAVTAQRGGGQTMKREAAEGIAQATAIPAMTLHSGLPAHRASLPALLPSSSVYPPQSSSPQSQFREHTSRSRSKSRRRNRPHRTRHRSATPGYEGGAVVEGSGMSIGEDVVDRLGELSFDEGEKQQQRRSIHAQYAGGDGERMEASGRRRSLSANRQSSRDRSLSVKRKRDGRMELEAVGLVHQDAYYHQEPVVAGMGGAGQGEEEDESVSPYDSDDDSVVDEEGEDEGMVDDAAVLPPLDDFAPPSSTAAYPSSSSSRPNTIFSPLDSFSSTAPPSSSSTAPPFSSSSSSPPKRKPGRPSKPGGPVRPRPRTVYAPLTEAEERQRRHVKGVLTKENLTQSDLAKMCGVSKASMCTWLQGSTSGAMHSKIWAGVLRWIGEVEARDKGREGAEGLGLKREEGEGGERLRGSELAVPVSPGTTSSSHSSLSSASSSQTS